MRMSPAERAGVTLFPLQPAWVTVSQAFLLNSNPMCTDAEAFDTGRSSKPR